MFDLYPHWPETVVWCKERFGYRWRARLCRQPSSYLADGPYAHVIDKPFGNWAWNNRFRFARYVVAGY